VLSFEPFSYLFGGRRKTLSSKYRTCFRVCELLEITTKHTLNHCVLPDHVLLHIFGYLDLASLCTLSQVCTLFHHLAIQDCVWISLYEDTFNSKIEAKELLHLHQQSESEKRTLRMQYEQRGWKKKHIRIMYIHHNKMKSTFGRQYVQCKSTDKPCSEVCGGDSSGRYSPTYHLQFLGF